MVGQDRMVGQDIQHHEGEGCVPIYFTLLSSPLVLFDAVWIRLKRSSFILIYPYFPRCICYDKKKRKKKTR